MHWKIPLISNKLGPDGELLEIGEYNNVDPFPVLSARRQEGRVLALNLPKEVGYRVIAMTLSKDGERFCGNTIGEERRGLRNNIVSNTLIKSVQALITAEPHLFKIIHW